MPSLIFYFFFFNDTATTEIYTLSLHDALPICLRFRKSMSARARSVRIACCEGGSGYRSLPTRRVRGRRLHDVPRQCPEGQRYRSEEHTSELQSHLNLVSRLLLA